MRSLAKQGGLSLVGLLMILFLIAFFTLLGLKLAPPYLNNFKVKSDLSGLSKLPDSEHLGRSQILDSLERRFEIDEVSYVHLSKNMQIKRITGGRRVTIKYDVTVPLIYNLSALVRFDDRQDLVGR